MDEYYYNPASGQAYSAYQLQAGFGIDPTETSVEILNYRGFYPVQTTSPTFDTSLYEATYTWALVPITGGEGAERVWIPVAKPLPDAKEAASQELTTSANNAIQQEVGTLGFSVDLLTGVASQAEIDRAARYQTELASIAAIADDLNTKLDAVEAATTVDEINAIVNPPTGVINIGRSGLDDIDLNQSYLVSFTYAGYTAADTELFLPNSSNVLPYDAGLPAPYTFDGQVEAFPFAGPFEVQLRLAATSEVLATITVPINPSNEDVPF